MIPLFEWFALVPAIDSSVDGLGEAILITASTGLVGMGLSDIASGLSERLSGGDDGDQDLTGDDGFDEGNGGGFGDGLDDDEFGDWEDDGEDLDDWGGNDDLDDFGDGGGQSDLEPRIDELENELATISSTMGTVRSENEAINETVEDIEDNIRKLLDIYEMVTRGVNPFVDDAQAGGSAGGSFGLFEDADDDDVVDDIDPDVADADADSFFDDDFDEGMDDDFDEEEFDEDAFAPDDVDDDSLEEGGVPASSEATSEGDEEGKTFDELKSEYETGTAEWEEDDDGDGEPVAATLEPESATDAGESTATKDVDSSAETTVDGTAGSVGSDPETEPATGERPRASEVEDDEGDADGESSDHATDGKPYLESVPSGYGTELLVIEWLSYLRGHSSTAEALRAIKYYETIGWIGASAADSLREYLSGLAGEDVTSSPTDATQLTIDHHTNSLQYIGKLGGKHVDVERLEWTGAGHKGGRVERRGQRGIQR